MTQVTDEKVVVLIYRLLQLLDRPFGLSHKVEKFQTSYSITAQYMYIRNIGGRQYSEQTQKLLPQGSATAVYKGETLYT